MANLDDHLLAAELAQSAGELLLQVRQELQQQQAAQSEIKDRGDQRAHEFLMQQLSSRRPADSVLSEESSEADRLDPARLTADRVWVIDPLDGTREFGEGRSDWAVHVALVEGGVPTAGAVSLPGLGIVFSTDNPPALPAPGNPLRVIVSRSRPPEEALKIAEALNADLVEMGSAGAKAMAILRGEADIYPHSGGQFEWDSCAPVAVATAAGLSCTRLDGSPLIYNCADPYLPDLLICRPANTEHVLAVVN
ncbi:MAG: 3'(2'),5'-bisphosphate nucleotidase CysQ [Actinomycetes bacterium]